MPKHIVIFSDVSSPELGEVAASGVFHFCHFLTSSICEQSERESTDFDIRRLKRRGLTKDVLFGGCIEKKTSVWGYFTINPIFFREGIEIFSLNVFPRISSSNQRTRIQTAQITPNADRQKISELFKGRDNS
jgi:hypothetical protein